MPDTVHLKIKGKMLGKLGPFTIYGAVKKPKRRGKVRVLVQIRQNKSHDFHVAECLSYTRSVDILFATDTERNSDGLIV